MPSRKERLESRRRESRKRESRGRSRRKKLEGRRPQRTQRGTQARSLRVSNLKVQRRTQISQKVQTFHFSISSYKHNIQILNCVSSLFLCVACLFCKHFVVSSSLVLPLVCLFMHPEVWLRSIHKLLQLFWRSILRLPQRSTEKALSFCMYSGFAESSSVACVVVPLFWQNVSFSCTFFLAQLQLLRTSFLFWLYFQTQGALFTI